MAATTAPAAAWFGLGVVTRSTAYYETTYAIVGVVFVLASVAGGLGPPLVLGHRWIERPFRWTAAQCLTAWGVAAVALGLLNLTPLCIGQDNGDGINDLALCNTYTLLVVVLYSGPHLFLVLAATVAGGVGVRSLGHRPEGVL